MFIITIPIIFMISAKIVITKFRKKCENSHLCSSMKFQKHIFKITNLDNVGRVIQVHEISESVRFKGNRRSHYIFMIFKKKIQKKNFKNFQPTRLRDFEILNLAPKSTLNDSVFSCIQN